MAAATLAIVALVACSPNSESDSDAGANAGVTGDADAGATDDAPSYEEDIPGIERDLAKQIDGQVSRLFERPVEGTEVDCPPNVDWEVGLVFRCGVQVPDSPAGFAQITVESDDGKYTWFINNQ